MLSTGRLLLIALLALVFAKTSGSQRATEQDLMVLHVGQGEEKCSPRPLTSCPDSTDALRTSYKASLLENGVQVKLRTVALGELEVFTFNASAITVGLYISSSGDCAKLIVCALNNASREISNLTVKLTNLRIELDPPSLIINPPDSPTTRTGTGGTTTSTGGTTSPGMDTEGTTPEDITTTEGGGIVQELVDEIGEEVKNQVEWYTIFGACMLSLILVVACIATVKLFLCGNKQIHPCSEPV